MMRQTHRFRTRVWLGLAVLCTGVLPGTCELRAKDAFVNGTKTWLTSTLLNPEYISTLAFTDATEGITGQ